MADRYDIVAPRKDRKNDKTRWTKVGVAFPSKQGDGFNLIFEAYPLPDENGEVRCNLFPPRQDRPQQDHQAPLQGQGSGDLNDDLPDF